MPLIKIHKIQHNCIKNITNNKQNTKTIHNGLDPSNIEHISKIRHPKLTCMAEQSQYQNYNRPKSINIKYEIIS